MHVWLSIALIAEPTEPTRYHLQDRSNGCRARDILDVNDIFQGHVYGRSLVVNGACLARLGAVAWLAAVCVVAQLCRAASMALRALCSAHPSLVFTFMAVMAFWKQAPEVSETAKRFVDVQQGVPSQPLPPPALTVELEGHLWCIGDS